MLHLYLTNSEKLFFSLLLRMLLVEQTYYIFLPSSKHLQPITNSSPENKADLHVTNEETSFWNQDWLDDNFWLQDIILSTGAGKSSWETVPPASEEFPLGRTIPTVGITESKCATLWRRKNQVCSTTVAFSSRNIVSLGKKSVYGPMTEDCSIIHVCMKGEWYRWLKCHFWVAAEFPPFMWDIYQKCKMTWKIK